jgi:hypothetical protein
MHQSLFGSAQVSESAQHGRSFHKVRARPYHMKDMHDQSLIDRVTLLFLSQGRRYSTCIVD